MREFYPRLWFGWTRRMQFRLKNSRNHNYRSRVTLVTKSNFCRFYRFFGTFLQRAPLLSAHASHATQSAHHAALQPAPFAGGFEHLPHLGVLPQQLIHFLHRRSRSPRNPLTPAPRAKLVLIPLLLGHRVDDGL